MPTTDLPTLAIVDHRAADAPERFCASLRETGFAALVHTPVEPALVQQVCDEWLAFFDSPAKAAYAHDPQRQDGWFAPEVSETAKGHSRKDLKEFFHLYPWGRYPAEVSDAARRYARQAEALAASLLGWVERHSPAEVRAGYSEPLPGMIDGSDQTLLRVLRYPPLRGDEPADALRAAPHEDINLLTVLPATSEPGLEVLGRDGRWITVPCAADAPQGGLIVINTGDMLQEASGGHFPSTTHRVANPTGEAARRSRVSLPLFLHPRPEVRLSARHTAGSYLLERLRELGLKP
ncbi:2OG-Fe(II) oxygenase family protein [Leptothrix discophora]|uniref:2-oxoglutarate-dependent ethylene/succinate-forming enzyme n=1 Tax=Leptothrix discophora TaxID=89 RepID=A0ABT9G5W8_LEPDI|nr:2OG-Fe(II) oxygenase family protein [Leptothrix discophora]MDP4301881.1 2OG-Fe(II) oxygenase family protein [Leptothrix discophora]